MARDLRLEVVLAAIDKATAPIKSITQGSVGLARTLKTTRDTLKGLQSQQKDISSFKALKGANDQTQQAMRASTDRVKALSRELANTSNPTKALNNEFKRAVRESQALKQKHGEQQRQLQTLRGRLSDAGISTKNLSQHERDLRQKLVSTNQTLKQQEDRLKRVTDQQNRMAKAKASYEKSQQLAGSMAASGAAGLAAGSGVLYAGARMIAPGIEYGAQMSELQSVTRLEKDSEQMKALRAQARELGASTAFSATEVGAGQTFLARAGFTPEAIISSMGDILDLALANGADLARTADIASNISSAFKIDPEVEGNITRVADVLSGTAARSNVNLEMLGDTMKYLGGADDLNFSLEQAAAMAGLLGNIGIQGSQAGTALRAMTNRLTGPAAAGRKAMESLGLQVADSSGQMRELPEILRDINKATKDMGNVERKALLTKIFGAEAGSGMTELVGQMSDGGLDELLDQLMNGVAGENARMAKTRADNIGGDLKGLSSAWEEIGVSISETNEGPLREVIATLTGIVRGVGEWMNRNPELVGTIAKVVAVLAALVAAGGALAIMLASVIGPLAMIRYGMTMLGIQGGAVIPVIKAVGATLLGLGKAMLTTPLGIFVAVAVVAAIMLIKYWDQVKAFFNGFVRGLIEGFKGMVYALTETAKRLAAPFSAITDALAPAVAWLGALIAPVDAAGDALQRAGDAGEWLGRIVGALSVLVGAALVAKMAGLIKVIILAGKAFMVLGKAVVVLIKTIAVSLVKAVVLAGKALLVFAKAALAAAIKGVTLLGKAFLLLGKAILANPIVIAIALIATAAYLLWKNWDGVVGGLKALWADLVSSTRFIWEPLLGFFQRVWGTIRAAFDGGIGGVSALIVNWSPLGLMYKAFAGVLGWFGIELPETFSQFGVGILSSLHQGLLGGVTSVMEFFGGLWRQIREAFAGGIGGVSALIINWSPLGLFYQAFAGVMNYFGVDLPGKFTEFGGMLMSGMVQGIKNGLGAVKDAITGAGDQAIGWFKDKLGIRSPSRVFASLGDDTMAGLESGLERSKSGPLASIIEAGKAIASAAAIGLGVAASPATADIVTPTDIVVDSRPPLQAAAAPITVQGDTITIQITAAPGTDTNELERMVNRVLEERERNKAARIRSSLYDND